VKRCEHLSAKQGLTRAAGRVERFALKLYAVVKVRKSVNSLALTLVKDDRTNQSSNEMDNRWLLSGSCSPFYRITAK